MCHRTNATVLCLLTLFFVGCATQPAKEPAAEGPVAAEVSAGKGLATQTPDIDENDADIELPVAVSIDAALLAGEVAQVDAAADDGGMETLTRVISVGKDPRDILEIDPDKGLSIYFYHLKNLAGVRMRIKAAGGSKPIFAETGPENTKPTIDALRTILESMVNLNAAVGETITFFEHNNMLVIRASQEKIERVRKYLAILDRERPQVMLYVKIAEISSDDDFQFGVDLRADKRSQSRPIAFDSFQARMFPQNYVDFLVSPNAAGWQGTTIQFSADTGITPEPFQYVVRALEEMGNANIVSTPEVIVAQGEVAMIRSGDDTPVVRVTTVGNRTDTSVSYRQTGVKLYVTPIAVNLEGCLVNFLAEFSLVTGFTPATVAGSVANPIISLRKVETTVFLTYDQMIRIGGLEVDEKRTEKGLIPFIGRIPIIGNLFGSTRDQTQARELYFFVKPTLYTGPEVIPDELGGDLPFSVDDLEIDDLSDFEME